MKNYFIKFFNKEKYIENKQHQRKRRDAEIFRNKYENYINEIQESLINKKEISFLHSGHIGDIINEDIAI